MVVICGVVGVLVGFRLGSQVGRCGSGHVCYLLCGEFSLTYFNKVKNNVGVKFVIVPNGYMVPNGNTFRIFPILIVAYSILLQS